MNECVNSYATIKYSTLINAHLNPLVPIFIFKNDMQEKETIINDPYGWKFPALDRASVLRKQSISRPEISICTGYW